jgi:serine/threonine protein kinase
MLACQPLFPGEEVKAHAAIPPAPIPGMPPHAQQAAAQAAAAQQNSSKPFQENQVKVVFEILGKPSEAQWKGLSACPHYSQISNWPSQEYPYRLDSKLSFLGTSHQGKELLKSMLLYDPAKRITAEDALKHQYFQEQPPWDKKLEQECNRGTGGE